MEIIQIKRELLITMENYIIQMDFMQKKIGKLYKTNDSDMLLVKFTKEKKEEPPK